MGILIPAISGGLLSGRMKMQHGELTMAGSEIH